MSLIRVTHLTFSHPGQVTPLFENVCLDLDTDRLASGVVISTVLQDTSHLKGSLRDYIEAQHIDATLCMTMLRKLDFDQPMETYSAGQKKKVLLAKSLSESAHLYIWDEPLNYIDLYPRLQLEEMIQTYQPTMLLVEHDQAFRENIATCTVALSYQRPLLQKGTEGVIFV